MYVRPREGEGKFYNGLLYSLPLELRDGPRLSQYARVDRTGWGQGEFGYAFYAHPTPTGDLLIIPGLMIAGVKRPTKRFHGYTQEWTKDQIQQFAAGISDYTNGVMDSAKEDMNLLVHDLRALSNAIYNSALEAQTWVERQNYFEVKKRLENVLASQGMLKMRTDALDFVGNPASVIQEQMIASFRKVDKVVRCFKSSAMYQRKVLNLSGESFGRVRGPDIFELIPYVLIDNAIKYSPEMYPIEVVASEGRDFSFYVESYGPYIAEQEREEIFKKGVRGRAALTSNVPGSGVGLHMAKKLVDENFHGSLVVEQDVSSDFVDGLYYHRTRFTVTIPLAA